MKYDLPAEIAVDCDGPVRIVTLNRPEQMNAVNAGLHRGLANVWRQLADDPAARSVVLTGAGRAFSAGGDLAWFKDIQTDPILRDAVMLEARDTVHAMVRCPLPVVAAVNGAAVGLGCSVAVLCDIVLMSDKAYFADPHVAIGLVAGDGGAAAWPVFMSLLRAKEYLLTGERIGPEQAERWGLANRVVEHESLLDEAVALAHRLAALPTKATRDTKRALNMHLESAISGVLEFALAAESECFVLEEHRARVDTFLTNAKG